VRGARLGRVPAVLAEVMTTIDRLWPLEGAEPWDAPGLVTGDPDAAVERVLLAVDAVRATVDEAIDTRSDLLIAHHPLLLRGVTTIAEDRYKGALLARLIRAGCALVGAHTNADIVERGTSAVLAERLDLRDVRPIVPGTDPALGLGRVGRLAEPTSLGRLARQLAAILPATATGVRVAGGYDDPVETVALCGGAGDSLLADPAVLAADVYITADLRHHPASEAREQSLVGGGPALIDVSHWASEWLWLDAAAAELRAAHPELDVRVSDLRTDPWDFQVVQ
jgi:dinuclear metal center YbgI/SA1388 family protein